MIWDFTCVDTLAASYVDRTSKKPCEAANLAEIRKRAKYQNLETNYIFYPVGIETFGAWGPSATKLIDEIGKKLFEVTREVKSTSYLKERISVAIQRGNAAALLGTIPGDDALEELFFIL